MPLVWVSRCRIVTLLGDVGVGEPELGQHLDDRGVEVELALVDQLHDDGRRPHLGDRADLEDRVGGRRARRCRLLSDAVRRVDELVRAPSRRAGGCRAGRPGPRAAWRAAASRRCQWAASIARAGRRCAGVLLHPVDDPAVVVDPVRRRAEQDEQVRGARVEHQLGRDARSRSAVCHCSAWPTGQRRSSCAVQHQRRRGDLVDPGERRHRGVLARGRVPRRAAELVAPIRAPSSLVPPMLVRSLTTPPATAAANRSSWPVR